MTDPKVAGQDPGTGAESASTHAPASRAPRRRRWAAFPVAAVALPGLTAGLVACGPSAPPPVLRPSGLEAGSATANSVAFHWSRPRTGPLPDKYLILSNGTVTGSVAGKVTSYQAAGLTPGTAYQYSVVAVRGGKRSRQSALVTMHTVTPPISQARLQGSWSVNIKNIGHVRGSRNGTVLWRVSPACTVGACDVLLHEKDGKYSLKMRLTRSGAVYRGHTVMGFSRCGPAHDTIPDPTALKFRVRITAAGGEKQAWAATSLSGTMVGTTQYVSSATFYCPAFTYKAALSGSQT